MYDTGDAFPSGSSPFLSGYLGPSPLTSDPAYRSANPSSLQMAQLWASHAHEDLCLADFLQFRPNDVAPASVTVACFQPNVSDIGYPPLPSSLYSNPYLSLGHLEPPSLSQHPLYDSHKGLL
ncbi:hypothetical protein INR49_028900 [Caranx melampygus]|nr:hypothetical protein INR49_028900 [Caranx melampygus]